MTTITNFLHSNFSDSAHKQESQVPIWVVTGTRENKITHLKQYQIDNCISCNKNLIHVDLGISTLKTLRNSESKEIINIGEGLDAFVPYKDKPYYIISPTLYRNNTSNCLQTLIKYLNSLFPKLQPQSKSKPTYSLIIEGLQLISSQLKLSASLQSFINHLSALDKSYKQITIYKYANVLSKQQQFALERISTCLTQIQNQDSAQNIWMVRSTVRRYTGFSNEQLYVVRMIKNGKCKVEKWIAPKENEETELQKQMINELGFVVKKGEIGLNNKDESIKIKQMIYPHLRIQNAGCKCNKKDCSCQASTCNNAGDEGIIILDDEQEDDDDIDV